MQKLLHGVRAGSNLLVPGFPGQIYDTASWEVITTAMLQDEGKRIEAMLLTEVSSVGPVLLTGGNNIVHLLKARLFIFKLKVSSHSSGLQPLPFFGVVKIP